MGGDAVHEFVVADTMTRSSSHCMDSCPEELVAMSSGFQQEAGKADGMRHRRRRTGG